MVCLLYPPECNHEYVDDVCIKCGHKITYEPFTLTKSNYAQAGIESLSGDVVIPQTFEYDGVNYKVTEIGEGAFGHLADLTSVTIPNSVISIGRNAFNSCYKLSEISIPDSVTNIGFRAFFLCNSLTDITIPASVTTIGESAFSGCESLTKIDVDTNNSNYKSVDGVLFTNDLSSLICYPCGKTSKSYNIPNGVISIENKSFYGCKILNHVFISNSVKTINEDAFFYCENLLDVSFSDGITYIGINAFRNCSSLKNITIPRTVTTIDTSSFYGCISLESIIINSPMVDIGDYAFYNCNGLLNSFIIPDEITNIGSYAFYGVPNIIYHGTATGSPWGARCVNKYTDDNGIVYENSSMITLLHCSNSKTGNIVIPSTVQAIQTNAFYNCNKLTEIIIPTSVSDIGINAFYNVLNISYNGTATGSPWGSICLNKYTEDEFAYETSSKTTLLRVARGVTEIIIPEHVTTISDQAFAYCSNLKSVKITSNVTSIGEKVFYECDYLTDITVTEGNQNYKSIDGVLFSKNGTILMCYPSRRDYDMTSYFIPENVINIYDYAFHKASFNLNHIIIPDSVTKIGKCAFQYSCITDITIPNNITEIGEYAFSLCGKLETINYKGNEEQWNAIVKGRNWNYGWPSTIQINYNYTE